MDFLEENKLLYKNQCGFRSKISTEQTVILFIYEIRSNVDKGNLVGSTFIDLSKAFDTISHSQLIAKLSMYDVHDRELCWLSNMTVVYQIKWMFYQLIFIIHCHSNYVKSKLLINLKIR